MGHRSLQLSYPYKLQGWLCLHPCFIVFDPDWNCYPPNNGSISPFPLVPDHYIFILLLIVYPLITCLGLLDKIYNQDG